MYHALTVKQGLVYICGYVLDPFGADGFYPKTVLFKVLEPIDESS